MGNYKQEYAKLNARQKEAVDDIDGPLLVIAGPGTGKTQLLGMRVANILQSTDIYPESILCLTFTNKAADNMKQRLSTLIGTDAHRVIIKTFHGLAADIMNRHPEYFWRGARLAIAPDAIQLEVIQRALMSLPNNHILAQKFAGQFTLVNDVSNSINLAKEAGLTPDKLRSIIQANMEYIRTVDPVMSTLGDIKVGHKSLTQISEIVNSLPEQNIDSLIEPLVSLQTTIKQSYESALRLYEESGKTASISMWKSRWIQKNDGSYGMHNEIKRNEWWNALADAYELYRKGLHSRGYYDYSDMLVEVIGQIEQNEDLRASLQEQFQYVLIDEFQDTNAAQLRLSHLIADHSDIEDPNIMAVGDDDQSIFKFQGAELSNMLGFIRKYENSRLIILTDNYRSTQAVLDAAESVITHSQYRLVNRVPGLTKQLKAQTLPKTKSNIKHISYRSREEHLHGLAAESERLFRAGNSVAILSRKHAGLRDLSMLLHRNGVPISYEQSNNILELPAIEQLFIILKIIIYIKKGQISSVNELLSLTMRHPMWNIDKHDLWEFAVSQQTKHDWLSGLLSSKNQSLNQIGNWLNWLSAISTAEPLAVVMEYILGLRDTDIMPSPLHGYYLLQKGVNESYIETLSAIYLLRTLVFEFRSTGIIKAEDFVSFVELMQQNNKIISDTSPFVSGDRAVELYTVHKAKGLEFDCVIVMDAVNSEWSPRTRGRIPPANLPLRPAEDDEDDYVRLMYVAATRAKHTLLFGSYKQSLNGGDVFPSTSLTNIPSVNIVPKKGTELVAILESTLTWPALEQKDESALLKPRLESFIMNVSNLINFLDVTKGGPQFFKERNLLRLPGSKSPAASMGSAIHAALQEAQLRKNAGKVNMRSVLATFEKSLLNEGLPEYDYKRKLTEGKHILNTFVEKLEWEFNYGAHPEYSVSNVNYKKARIGGTLDVLDLTESTTIITDYKTGKPLHSLAILSGDEGVKAWRHKLQLIFYSILVDIDPNIRNLPQTICQMVYVEADSLEKAVLRYAPTVEEQNRTKALILSVWKHIMSLDLPDTSAYSKDAKGIRKFEQDLIDGII